MANLYAAPVQELIDEFGRLPGIGPKSAQRIAYYILKRPKDDALRLARAIAVAKEKVVFCARCFNIAEITVENAGEVECGICIDPKRNTGLVCVLQGAINHLEGIGPDQLRIKELLQRLGTEDITEVILCTNPNLDGEATAMYLARLLKPLGIVVSRIASGLPVGGDLEYADELTLGRALEGRRNVQ
jgi:recombination protein RecR